jgi:two-component system cell cycle sensor histidine kinase/response regulator CckA
MNAAQPMTHHSPDRSEPGQALVEESTDALLLRLQQSEKKYRDLVETSHNLIWSIDAQGCCTFVNRKAAQDIYGYVPEEVIGRRFTDFVPPEHMQRELEVFQRLMGGEQVFSHETTHLRKDGGRVHLSYNAIPLLDDDRRVIGATGTAIDITQRKLAEEELAETQQRFEAFMDKLPLLVFVRDLGGAMVYLNDTYCRTMQRPRQELLGTTEFDLWPADVAALLRRNSEAVLAADRPIELRERVPTPDGLLRDWWVLKFPFRDRQGRIFVGGMALDLTEHEQLQRALRASEARYRSLVEHLDQPIFLKDRELRFVTANPTFCRMLGCSEADLRGQTDAHLFPPEVVEAHRHADLAVLRDGRSSTVQEQLMLGGRSRTLRVERSPVRDERGSVVAVLGIGFDVTDQLALERQLRHVQKMEAVGQLAGGVAHDFNNLLTAILANLSLVLGDTPVPAAAREALQSAEQATIRAAELTRTLLGFARRTPLQTVPLALGETLAATLKLVRASLPPEITLQVDMPHDLWLVEADPDQLEQVLTNLTLNARDAMPRGGRLQYAACNFVPTPDYLRSHVEAQHGEFVRLRVGDTGCGIPPEIRQRIFEPFFTTKPKGHGTGLGLATAFSIVKQHSGWIECHSEPGRGTTFDIFLPRSLRERAAAAERPAPRTGHGGHETILVVDDESAVRDAAKNILTQAGYQVLLAADGAKALEIYRVLRRQIALVILDSVMPNLSGRETLESLARLNPHVRVLFSTGYCNDQQAVKAVPQVCGYLPKPYRAEELTLKVRQMLDA